MNINKAVEMILNNEIKDKKTYRNVDKTINENLHLILNKKEIISKLDKIKYKVLYNM